jgi:Flp pilus assembly protein TadG
MPFLRRFDDPLGQTLQLARSHSGNVAILFALSLFPLVGLAGLGIDYGIALSAKTRLDTAADAAAIAGVATAKAFVAANPTDATLYDDAIAAGTDRANRAFMVNAGSIPFALVPQPTIKILHPTTQTFTASVTYTTTSKNQFGKMFGTALTTVSGSVRASADIPSYLDFYLLIDVSASMGLPATTYDQTQLANANGGCQFACHFPGNGKPGANNYGYNYALSHTIQLRSGAVNSAVCQLLKLAGSPAVPNQYRVGLYPFVTQMATLAASSATISNVSDQAGCSSSSPSTFTSLLDIGSTQLATNNDPSTGTGSGGTHFEVILPQIKNTITSFGDGSSSIKSKSFVFLITDGMDNGQHYAVKSGSTYYYPGASPYQTFSGYGSASFDGSSPQTINASQCNALKTAGATISILYIPYSTLTVGASNAGETIATNNAIPNVPTTLKNCASSGFFYTANTPSDITAALSAMFNQAIQVAHLQN